MSKMISTPTLYEMLLHVAIHRIRQWQEHKSEVEKVIESNFKQTEGCEEALLLKAQNETVVEKPPIHKVIQQPKIEKNISNEPKPAPRLKPVTERPIVREETFVKTESRGKESSDRNQLSLKEIPKEVPEPGSRKSTPKSSIDRTLEDVKNRNSVSIEHEKDVIERDDVVKNVKSNSASLEKKNTVDSQLSKHSQSSNEKCK